jgi:hypothetical protein
MQEAIELSKWDQLLAKIGINEQDALNAIVHDCETGRSIRRFVRNSANVRFVPVDALHAVSMYRELLSFTDED